MAQAEGAQGEEEPEGMGTRGKGCERAAHEHAGAETSGSLCVRVGRGVLSPQGDKRMDIPAKPPPYLAKVISCAGAGEDVLNNWAQFRETHGRSATDRKAAAVAKKANAPPPKQGTEIGRAVAQLGAKKPETRAAAAAVLRERLAELPPEALPEVGVPEGDEEADAHFAAFIATATSLGVASEEALTQPVRALYDGARLPRGGESSGP
jgi:hypothetical protein